MENNSNSRALGEQKMDAYNLPAQRQTPISRLPPEILATIFIHLARNHYLHECRPWTVPSWINVSYVSRRWRNVALSSPTLWTSLRWTDELLARSKQAPLKIDIQVGGRNKDVSWWLTLLEKLMNHGERIQEFSLSIPTAGEGPYISKILSKLSFRSSHLRKLSIRVFRSRRDAEHHLPTVLVDGDIGTPALRKLQFRFCPVPWPSLTLNSLKTLDLIGIPTASRNDPIEFVSMLGAMQGLEKLELCHALLLNQGSSPLTILNNKSHRSISLPRLTRLFLEESFPVIVTLLSFINIPPESQIMLICGESCDIEPPFKDYNFFFSLFANKFKTSQDQESSRPRIRTLVVHCERPGVVSLVFILSKHDDNPIRTRELAGNILEWNRNIPLKIVFEAPDPEKWIGDGNRIIEEVFRTMPLENVESFHGVDVNLTSPDCSLWNKTFGRLSNLRHIKLTWTGVSTLISLLRNHPRDPDMEDLGGDTYHEHQISAPALEELELHDVYFSSWKKLTELEGRSQYLPDVESLLDVLRTRDTRCKLTMTECCGPEDGSIKIPTEFRWMVGR